MGLSKEELERLCALPTREEAFAAMEEMAIDEAVAEFKGPQWFENLMAGKSIDEAFPPPLWIRDWMAGKEVDIEKVKRERAEQRKARGIKAAEDEGAV